MANMWMTYDSIDAGLFSINYMCPVLDNFNDYTSIKFTRWLWYLLLIKILDLVETVIFVLRKKNNQISILHLYHHVSSLFVLGTGPKNCRTYETMHNYNTNDTILHDDLVLIATFDVRFKVQSRR